MTCIDFSSYSDDALFVMAQEQRDSAAWQILVDRYQDRILSWSRKKLRFLPDDLHLEVVQQTWEGLLCAKTPFDPQRGSSSSYFYGFFQNAYKRILRDYRYKPGDARDKRPKIISIDQVREDSNSIPVDEILADPNDTIAECDEQLHVESLLTIAHQTAPSEVSRALQLVYNGDVSISQASKSVGVDRVTLTRRIRKWGREVA